MTEQRRTALDVIQVQNPCPADWQSMAGDERTRFCEGCGRHVHNLSAMTAGEAERLVCEAAGRLCVRYTVAADGAVQTIGYRPQPPAKWRWTRWGWRVWAGVGVCGAAAATLAHVLVFGTSLVRRPQPPVVMGDMCVPPITAPATPAGTGSGEVTTGQEP